MRGEAPSPPGPALRRRLVVHNPSHHRCPVTGAFASGRGPIFEPRRFRPPSGLASRACAVRKPASRSPLRLRRRRAAEPRAGRARTCSRRCSCGAGWASRRRRARFLAAEEAHPLEAFGGLRDGAGRHPRPRRAALAHHRPRRLRRRRHRSTAILVRALRTLGADVDWYLPSRIDDGYGLAARRSSGWPRAGPTCW